MVGPLISALVGAAGSHVVTKKNEEEKTERKLELVKELASLTPDQAAAVDAVKKQTVEEMEDRVTLGWGPFKELPPQASERARQMRAQLQERMRLKFSDLTDEQKQGLALAVGQLTAEERAKIANAADPQKAIDEVVNAKVERAKGGA